MFETVEIGAKIPKEQYDQRLPELRVELLGMQYALRKADFPVIILIAGDDRLGCHDVINALHELMDPRSIETNAFGEPTDEEEQRPEFWRYWRTLPAAGRIGVYFGAWATRVIAARYSGNLGRRAFERKLEDTRLFEQTLADGGALILKFWLHLPREELKRRLKKAGKESGRWWRMGKADWRIYEAYDKGLALVEEMIEETSTGSVPWRMVESTDARHRDLTIAEALLAAAQARLSQPVAAGATPSATVVGDPHTLLDQVDLAATLTNEEYEEQLVHYQRKLNQFTDKALDKGESTVMVFEGWDAAGKGGLIRRLTTAIDAANYRTIPIAAPTDEEKAHHYLWRFWRQLPRGGRVTIFDRSWYGRVLVERVEGFARPDEWMRAYAEINNFEEQLVDHGVVVLKFWLHIGPDEQLRRFKEREQTPFKQYKITEDDYRNRERWKDYELAVNEMVARTSTRHAPWHVISATSKHYARVEVLKTACKRLGKRL